MSDVVLKVGNLGGDTISAVTGQIASGQRIE